MRIVLLNILLILILSCSSTEKKRSPGDIVLNIYMDPCTCTSAEYISIAEKSLLSDGLEKYSKENLVILDPMIKEEILEQPKKFLYDVTLDLNNEAKEPKKDLSNPVITTEPDKNNLAKKEDSLRPYEGGKYLDFDGYNDEKSQKGNTIVTAADRPKASGKIDTAEIENYLKDKEVHTKGQYKIYGHKTSYGSKGLEAVKSFESDRHEYKKQLEKRRENRIKAKKEQFDKYKLP